MNTQILRNKKKVTIIFSLNEIKHHLPFLSAFWFTADANTFSVQSDNDKTHTGLCNHVLTVSGLSSCQP